MPITLSSSFGFHVPLPSHKSTEMKTKQQTSFLLYRTEKFKNKLKLSHSALGGQMCSQILSDRTNDYASSALCWVWVDQEPSIKNPDACFQWGWARLVSFPWKQLKILVIVLNASVSWQRCQEFSGYGQTKFVDWGQSSSWGHSSWKVEVFAVRETGGETKRQRLHAQEIVNQKWSFPSKGNCQVTAKQGQNGEEFPQPISTLPRQPKHPQIVRLVKVALDWQCPKMPRKNYALSSKASDFPNVSKAWASCWFWATMPRNSRNLRTNSQT